MKGAVFNIVARKYMKANGWIRCLLARARESLRSKVACSLPGEDLNKEKALQSTQDEDDIKTLSDGSIKIVKLESVQAAVRHYFCQLFQFDINKIWLTELEHRQLAEEDSLGLRSSQFLAWRRSLLWCGTVFFAALVALDSYVLSADSEAKVSMESKLHERYHQYFEGMHRYNTIFESGTVAGAAFAVLCAMVGALFWRTYTISGPALLLSFICSYCSPFLLLLVLPFRTGIDFDGIQTQICKDFTSLQFSQKENVDSRWPKVPIGDLANALIRHNLVLEENLCDQDPRKWGQTIADLIETEGYAMKDGTCPKLETNVKKITSTLGVSTSCPADCGDCTGNICSPILPQLLSLQGIGISSDSSELSVFSSDASKCVHCVSPGLQCVPRCADIQASITRNAMLGGMPEHSRPCIEPENLHDFKYLSTFFVQTAHWKTMLGVFYGMRSVLVLLPLAFSLLFGASKGSRVAKSVIPYSRLPGVISRSASIFAFPFIMQFAVLVQNAIGSICTLIGTLLLLAAIVINMNVSSLASVSQEEAMKKDCLRAKCARLCLVTSIALFLVDSVTNQSIRDGYNAMCGQNDMCLTYSDVWLIKQMAFWMAVRLGATMLGKSLIATAFFADLVISLTYYFHYSQMVDPVHIQAKRSRRVGDLRTLFVKKDRRSCGVEQSNTEEHAFVSQSLETVVSMQILAEASDSEQARKLVQELSTSRGYCPLVHAPKRVATETSVLNPT